MDLNFTEQDGTNCKYELTIYALSTCGFCKRAINFLKENSIKFKYVYFDELDMSTQEQLKRSLTEQFGEKLAFPFVVIENKKCMVGFEQQKWEKELL
jgi:glutaredoxin-like protein NrdH